MRKLKIACLILSLGITAILAFFAFKPVTQCFEINLTADIKKDVNFSVTNWMVSPDSDGIIGFFIMGSVNTPDIIQCKLEISPSEEGRWYLQTGGYQVIDRMFIGRIQLGSIEYPMTKDQHYGFRLTDNNDRLLSQGTISAQAHRIFGTSSFLLITVSILASVLQMVFVIVSAIWERTKTV